jgi:hypothetical protein
MKKTKKPGKRGRKPERKSMALEERKLYDRHTIRFPQMKGRVVEAIEFFTIENHHDVTIEFKDKTALYLTIDPSFSLHAFLQKMTKNEAEVIQAWPTISLEA